MQQIYVESYFKKGFRNLLRYSYTMDHSKRDIIEKRLKIIEFFDEFGKRATEKAFGVSRSTVFLWKKKIKDSNGELSALAPLSKAPKNKRRGQTPKEIEEFIIRYRKEHPRVGQLTIKLALDEYCKRVGVKTISISTIGRLIKKLKKQGLIKDNPAKLSFYARSGNFKERIKRRYKKLRRKGYKPDKPGDLVQIDSITIFEDGLKRYILTGIDLKTRFAFGCSYTTLSSLSARDFMEKFRKVAPLEIKRIQTDNGCEFEKYFR